VQTGKGRGREVGRKGGGRGEEKRRRGGEEERRERGDCGGYLLEASEVGDALSKRVHARVHVFDCAVILFAERIYPVWREAIDIVLGVVKHIHRFLEVRVGWDPTVLGNGQGWLHQILMCACMHAKREKREETKLPSQGEIQDGEQTMLRKSSLPSSCSLSASPNPNCCS
jgi:hypothetical protein